MKCPLVFLSLFGLLFSPQLVMAWNTPGGFSAGGSSKTAWTWTGNVSTDWSNGANWCGAYLEGVCKGQSTSPPTNAVIVFNDACNASGRCNPTISADIDVASINMMSSYSGNLNLNGHNLNINTNYGLTIAGGTFTQGTGNIVMTATSTASVKTTFKMTGGTFVGGSGNITVGTTNTTSPGALVYLDGGSFTSTSGTFTVAASTVRFTGLSSFSNNNGTFYFFTPSDNTSYSGTATRIFNHITFAGDSNKSHSLTADITLDGDLRFASTGASGITLSGNKLIVRQGDVYQVGSAVAGSTDIWFTASTAITQDLDCSGGTLNKEMIGIQASQTSASADLRIVGNCYFVGGFDVTGNLGTLSLSGVTGITFGDATGYYNTGASLTLPSLTVLGPATKHSFGTVKVSGDLTIGGGGTANSGAGGTIEVGGNITNAAEYISDVTIVLNGAGNQSISGSSPLPSITVNKSGGTLSFAATPTFSHNFTHMSGTVTIPTTVQFGQDNRTFGKSNQTITSNGLIWNNVIYDKRSSSAHTLTLADTLTISGNLTMDNEDDDIPQVVGSIRVQGNITTDASASGIGLGSDSTGTIELYGSGQSINFTATQTTESTKGVAYLPPMIIASAGGTTTITGYVRTEKLTYSSGTVDATGSTMTFKNVATATLTVGSTEFGSVRFVGDNATITGTMKVNGSLTVASGVNSTRTLAGAIDVYGDVTYSGNGYQGAATLQLLGNNSAFTRTSTSLTTGTITVAKTAGQKVSLGSSLVLNSGQSMSVTSGQVDVNGALQSLAISGGGALTLAASTEIKLSGGILSVGGSSIPAGPYSSGTVIP